MNMRNRELGFSLLEVLGALAIGVIMTAGLSAIINTSIEDTKGQQAALYQAQVVAATAKYISTNYGTLVTKDIDTTPEVIKLDILKTDGFLAANFGPMNAYGQTPCVLVLKTTKIKAGVPTPLLNALIVTEGGTPIRDVDIASVAAQSGQGGGYISQAEPNVARGAYNSWNLSASTTPTLANFLSRNCSGTAATSGNLASALFYDGPDQVAADYLYRNAVAGQPELNQMNAPIHMVPGTGAQATEGDTTDPRCTATSGTGKIAVDAQGKILTCQAGAWKSSGAGYWRDPVATFADLPSTGNTPGDVRIVTSQGRAFVWSTNGGGSWIALAVDQNGDLTVPRYLQLNTTEIKNTACPSTGLIAKGDNGQILSCQNGLWQSQSTMELGDNWGGCVRIQPSKLGEFDWPLCPSVHPQNLITYDDTVDTYAADILIKITPTRNGVISVSASSYINRTLANAPSFYAAQLQLHVQLIDDDTGLIVGSNLTMTPALINESAAINTSLLKSVKPNTNGYTIRITDAWSFFNGQQVWDEANYINHKGQTIQQTPLRTIWNIDLFY